MTKKSSSAFRPTFQSMSQLDVPQSRNGKHRKIINAILADVEHLAVGSAVKVPLAALGDSKEKIRAALSRECRKRELALATAADADHLYVWRQA